MEEKIQQEHYLSKLFKPNSIAVIGASEKAGSAGKTVFENLEQGYQGKLFAVNPKYSQILGRKAYAAIQDIKETIELAVIVTPAETVPDILTQCGSRDIHHAIIISAGFKEIGDAGSKLEDSIKAIVKQYNMHVLGPNCLGLISPEIKMNATFGNTPALFGSAALISQSGAICAAILDWAIQKKIGFSTVVSLGNAADLGFGEILDYLNQNPNTKSILMYIEGITHPKSFIDELKSAAQSKPIIVLKAGHSMEGTRAIHSHTGAMIGLDDVFSSVLKHAGAVRVATLNEFYNAALMLSKNISFCGAFVTILSNGGGAGVIAADEVSERKLSLSELSKITLTELTGILPKSWSHNNPIDILGDAKPDRFVAALNIAAKDENCKVILIILVPVAMAKPLETATQIISMAAKIKTPILTCWMGNEQVKEARDLFNSNGIPSFETPEEAMQALSFLVLHQEYKKLINLSETFIAKNRASNSSERVQEVLKIFKNAINENRTILNTIESKEILRLYGIPAALPFAAKTVEECGKIANQIGFPLVMKILSPDITHKQDVGGVQLNIATEDAAVAVFKKMIQNAKEKYRNAKIEGVTLERMYRHHNNRELMIGVIKDPVFGQVISFGAGGSIVEVMQDRAIALPPLNIPIIENLISETKVSKLLGEFRGMPGIKIETLKSILLNISEMVADLPQITEMDINPLIANEDDVIAVDARFVIDPKQCALL